MLIDLHVKAGPGCPIEQLPARLSDLGLDGAVVSARDALLELAPTPDAPKLFAGAEVETDRGRYLLIFPHPKDVPPLVDVFGPRESAPWPIRDVIVRTRALRGAVIALTPYDATLTHPGGDILYTLPALAAVQTVSPRHPSGLAHPAIEAAEVLGLPCVGGSDAATLDEVGCGATLFGQPVRDEADLIAALQAGACWPVEFGMPSGDLLQRGRSTSAREVAPVVPPSEGPRRRRRRR